MISIYLPPEQATRAARRLATASREQFRAFPDAIRLRNEDSELIVVPSCGRIMHYAATGGENLLWENAAIVSRTLPAPSTPKKKKTEWNNLGGDKAWPWPQSRWPQAIRRDWPPPAALDQPHAASVLSRCSVSLSSEVLAKFELRVARQIALAPRGSRVTIDTTLEPASSSAAPLPWAAWSITQIPVPRRIAVRINSSTDLPGGYKALRRETWGPIRCMGGDVLLTDPPRDHPAKFGADGDVLAADLGDWLFVQKRIDAPDLNAAGRRTRRLSGEAAQVYSNGPDQPYVELEFTGLRGMRTPALKVQWEMLPWNEDHTDADLAAVVRAV